MELDVSRKSGLIESPLYYLERHDGGDHKLSLVLVKYFEESPKKEDETFGAYMKRLISDVMPMGSLEKVYNEQLKKP